MRKMHRGWISIFGQNANDWKFYCNYCEAPSLLKVVGHLLFDPDVFQPSPSRTRRRERRGITLILIQMEILVIFTQITHGSLDTRDHYHCQTINQQPVDAKFSQIKVNSLATPSNVSFCPNVSNGSNVSFSPHKCLSYFSPISFPDPVAWLSRQVK